MLASGGKSIEEVVTAILQARHVNTALGGAVVGPGDLDELQMDFIDGCQVLATGVPEAARKMRGKEKDAG